ncbi:MAG: ribosome silencing factor [Arcobacteraceae bacterium]|nr:ribosome silencing factor [Arcobacteraceae bacterium]
MEERLKRIVELLDARKAEDIEVFDLTDKGYITNQVIIATALNTKHSLALLEHLKVELKPAGEEFVRTEEDGDWTIVDLGDILIHLMTQEYRDKYTLENFLENFSIKDGELY